jgi:hypothetical protein
MNFINKKINKFTLQDYLFAQQKCRVFTTSVHTSSVPVLDPWFVTGFTDAEGCFSVLILKNPKYKAGWVVKPCFQIQLHKKDLVILNQLKAYFGSAVGEIYEQKSSATYMVRSIKDLNNIILPHFIKYPLITQKWADFELFKQVVEMMNRKEHLTLEGLHKIVGIRASINNGSSDTLKSVFPNISSVLRPVVVDQEIKDPKWLVGFTSGDGSFLINTLKTPRSKLNMEVRLEFKVTQHSRDAALMKSLVQYFGCGNSTLRPSYDVVDFRVTRFTELVDKIIPFFDKYPIVGVKAKDILVAVLIYPVDLHIIFLRCIYLQ